MLQIVDKCWNRLTADNREAFSPCHNEPASHIFIKGSVLLAITNIWKLIISFVEELIATPLAPFPGCM